MIFNEATIRQSSNYQNNSNYRSNVDIRLPDCHTTMHGTKLFITLC